MRELLSKLKEFDIAALLPDMNTFFGQLAFWMGFALVVGPLVMGLMGAWYYFAPPKEANHAVGFRTKWSMASVQAWRYAQRLAGFIYMILGGALFAVMLVVSLFFGAMEPVTMAVTAFFCVLAEALLALGAHIFVEMQLRKHYDVNGNLK